MENRRYILVASSLFLTIVYSAPTVREQHERTDRSPRQVHYCYFTGSFPKIEDIFKFWNSATAPPEGGLCEGAPCEVGAAPSEVGAVNSEVGFAPSEVGAAPSEVGVVPSEAGAPPSEVSAAPYEVGAAPCEIGAAPSEVGAVNSEVGFAPSEVGAAPSEVGVVPSEAGTSPSEVSAAPSEDGAVPSESGGSSKNHEAGAPTSDSTSTNEIKKNGVVKKFKSVQGDVNIKIDMKGK